jgi:hypothetical protein
MVKDNVEGEKLAVTVVAALNVTWQLPLPLHPPPLQPVKTEFGFAMAVNVIVVPIT